MPTLRDDPELLRLLQRDAARQPAIYQPGPYWRRYSRNTANAIAREGLSNFRGESVIGHGFSDALHTDVRRSLNSDGRQAFRWLMQRVFPFNWLFDMQVATTRAYAAEVRRLIADRLADDPTVRDLLARYTMPESTLGGCIDTVTIDGQTMATTYLHLLHRHDAMTRQVDMSHVRAMLEIGGGFGANLHLVLTNHPSVRKVVYLDISPTLYVGTQYLRAFYDGAVRDYRETRGDAPIRFRDDDTLEILCVPVWQIGQLDVSVDLVYNAHSFVEMPRPVVAHYARHCTRLSHAATATTLVSYDCNDASTIPPDQLPGLFPAFQFTRTVAPRLDGHSRDMLFVGRH